MVDMVRRVARSEKVVVVVLLGGTKLFLVRATLQSSAPN